MGIRIVEDRSGSRFRGSKRSHEVVVTVAGQQREDFVDNKAAYTMATSWAQAEGWQVRGLSNTPTPVPVDRDGDTAKTASGEAPPTEWWAEYRFNLHF